MSQNTVKNFFLQLDTAPIVGYFKSLPTGKQADMNEVYKHIALFGNGAVAKKKDVKTFPIDLVNNQDVNITLVPKELTTSNRVFFNSPEREAPFKVGGNSGSNFFEGNYHHFAVSMHLTATEILEDPLDMTLNITIVPAGNTVNSSGNIEFTIDPQLQIKQPSTP